MPAATPIAEVRARLAGRTVFVVPYCHADYAWITTRPWHVNRYAFALQEVVALCDRYPEFRYFFDSSYEFLDDVMAECPDLAARLRELVAAGRIGISCGHYSNLRHTTAADETICRNLTYGLERTRQRFPTAPLRVYGNLDVEIGHGQVPQLMRLAGIDAYMANRPLHFLDREGVPRIARWQGLSGDTVELIRQVYSSWQVDFADCWRERWDDFLVYLHDQYLAEYCNQDSPVALVFDGSDDSRPSRTHTDQYMDWPAVIAHWNATEDSTLRYGTPDEILAAVEAEFPARPTVRCTDPAALCYHVARCGTYGVWRQREMLDRQLVEAEAFAALASATTAARYPGDRLRDHWDRLLQLSAHAQEMLYPHEREPRYSDLVYRAEDARLMAHAAIDARVGHALPFRAGGLAIVNPLPWERRERLAVRIYHHDYTTTIPHFTLNGETVPCQGLRPGPQPLEVGDGWRTAERDCVIDVTVPPMGHVWLGLDHGDAAAPKAEPPAELPPDTTHAGLTFAANRLVAWETAGLSLTGAADNGILDLVAVPYVGTWTPKEIIRGQARVGTWTRLRLGDHGPLAETFLREGTVGPYTVSQAITVYPNLPYLDVRTAVEVGRPESMHIGLSLPIADYAASSLTADIPFGVEPRDVDSICYADDPEELKTDGQKVFERRFQGLIWARSWIDLCGPAAAVAMIQADGHKYWFVDAERRRVAHILLDTIHPPGEDDWSRPMKVYRTHGVHELHHRVYLHRGDWRALNLPRRAAEFHHPPVPHYAPASPAAGGLDVGPESVVFSAMFRLGDATCVRLYNAAPEAVTATLKPAWPARTARKLDLNNQPLTDPADLSVPLGPWEIATVRLA